MKPAFVISTGDNFYPNGLTSGQDPQISSSFVAMYTDPSLQVSGRKGSWGWATELGVEMIKRGSLEWMAGMCIVHRALAQDFGSVLECAD